MSDTFEYDYDSQESNECEGVKIERSGASEDDDACGDDGRDDGDDFDDCNDGENEEYVFTTYM